MSSSSPVVPLQSVQRLILRELKTLQAEIEAYPDDSSLWQLAPGISNSGGTLALHLCGNLQHYIGACLGKSGYVRDRTNEFASRDLSTAEIVRRIGDARRVVQREMGKISAAQLQQDFPEAVGGATLNTAGFLVHLACHLAFHLGQIDYHRRLTTGGEPIPGALGVSALVPEKD